MKPSYQVPLAPGLLLLGTLAVGRDGPTLCWKPHSEVAFGEPTVFTVFTRDLPVVGCRQSKSYSGQETFFCESRDCRVEP